MQHPVPFNRAEKNLERLNPVPVPFEVGSINRRSGSAVLRETVLR